ncbi:hypothetical protein ACEPPN_012016 [Leptodophora sp. 'Broadleaf-Isolate-01']
MKPSAPKTSSSLISMSSSISRSSAVGEDLVPTTTSVTESVGTPKQDLTPSVPSTSLKPVGCITTVTSILGQFLVLGTGACSQTVTIVSTVKEVFVPGPTQSGSWAVDSATSAGEIQTPAFPFPTNPSHPTQTGVSTSAVSASITTILPPKPCTATVTSTLGKPFVPFPGFCSETVTIVTTAVDAPGPQPTSTWRGQPPIPINSGIDPNLPTTFSISTSLKFNPAPLPQETESNSPNAGPAITIPKSTFSVPIPTVQVPQPIPETTTSQVPVAPIPATTTQSPELPNSLPTSEPELPAEITTSPLTPPNNVPTTQEPQDPPTSTREPVAPPCTTVCSGPQPTIQPISVPTVSLDMPVQSSTATETRSLPPNEEQEPTPTLVSGTTTAEGISSALAAPSLLASIITNTPTPGAIAIGSQTVTQDTASNFIFGSQTLVPGSAITVNGHQISAAASGGALILNPAPPKSTSSPSAEAGSAPAPAVVVVDGTSITGNTESGFVIGTQTLFPGSAITASGQVITLPSPITTQTPAPTQTPSPETIPVILIGSSTFTQNSASAFIIGSQTLSPGSAVTISGQVISLSPTGNAVIVNGATATRNPTTFSTEIQAPITSLVVAGQTLTAGGRVTVGGDVLSLAGGAITVIGTVTVGGGEVTATATPTGKKSLAGRFERNSKMLMALQMAFVFGLGSFGLF